MTVRRMDEHVTVRKGMCMNCAMEVDWDVYRRPDGDEYMMCRSCKSTVRKHYGSMT